MRAVKNWHVAVICILIFHVFIVHGFIPLYKKHKTTLMTSEIRRFQSDIELFAKNNGYPKDLEYFLDVNYEDKGFNIRKSDWYKSIYYYDPLPANPVNNIEKVMLISILPDGVYLTYYNHKATLIYY